MAKKITITDPYDLNNVSTPDETSPTLIALLTALEAEVKRLRERKACCRCKGVGWYKGDLFQHVTCDACNGTGYIGEDKC